MTTKDTEKRKEIEEYLHRLGTKVFMFYMFGLSVLVVFVTAEFIFPDIEELKQQKSIEEDVRIEQTTD